MMFPIAANVHIVIVLIVVVRRDVDILGAITNPVPLAPSPIVAIPSPGSVNPDITITRRRGRLLIERLRR